MACALCIRVHAFLVTCMRAAVVLTPNACMPTGRLEDAERNLQHYLSLREQHSMPAAVHRPSAELAASFGHWSACLALPAPPSLASSTTCCSTVLTWPGRAGAHAGVDFYGESGKGLPLLYASVKKMAPTVLAQIPVEQRFVHFFRDQVDVGETAILLHPPVPLFGISIWINRGCHQQSRRRCR